MFDPTRRSPEVALLERHVDAILNPHTAALQTHSPLLLGMRMDSAGCIRLAAHQRQHRLLAGKNAGRNPLGKLPKDPLRGVVNIVKIFDCQNNFSLAPALVSRTLV